MGNGILMKNEEFLKYATDPTPGNAGRNLEPIGRFCTKEKSEEAFIK